MFPMKKRNLYAANPGSGFSARKKSRLTTNQKIAAVRAAQLVGKRSTSSLAARNIRTAGLLGFEKKYYDTSIVYTNLTAAVDCTGAEYDPGTVLCVSAPAQGAGAQNRDGKKIIAKSIEINGTVSLGAQTNQTAADVSADVLVAVVLDTQTNAAQLNSEDVYTNPSADASGLTGALRNLSFGSRFRILKLQHFDFPPMTMSYDGTNIEQSGQQKTFRWFIPLKDLPINFNSTSASAGVAQVQDNSIHVIAFTTSAITALCYNARLRFVG